MAWKAQDSNILCKHTGIYPPRRDARTRTRAAAAQRTAGRRGGRGAASGSLPTRMRPGCRAQRPLEGACGVIPRDGSSEGHVCTPSRPLWRGERHMAPRLQEPARRLGPPGPSCHTDRGQTWPLVVFESECPVEPQKAL